MILGADTDELREVQGETQEFAQKVDQVVMALTILVAILKAASIWTGGSSLKFALYLEKTVIPWLRIISASAKAFAQILGANAQAQDDVSAGHTVDFSALPRYSPAQLPSSTTADFPVMSVPTGGTVGATVPVGGGAVVGGTTTVPGGGVSGTAPEGSTYTGGSSGAVGGTGGVGGALPSGGGTGSGSTWSGGSGGLGGGSGATGGTPGGTGTGTYAGTGGSGALGGGSAGTASSTSGTSTYGVDTSSYDGPGGSGTSPDVTEGEGGSNAGTYAAAGAAGALGVGGAAALAGRDLSGAGRGFSSPDGFDYTRVQGVRDNPNVTPEFLRRTEQIATKLGARPEDLLAVMSFETGGSFSAAQKNMAGGSATGLIQFMPATARGLGTTTAALAAMTPVQQLDYVEKYFGNGRYTTVEGLYSKVLAGRAVNDPEGVLFREGTRAYRANRGVDIDGNGLVTAGEAAAKVRARITPGP